MSNRAAIRYAKAIIEVAIEQNNLELVHRDFELINTMIKEIKEFVLFLKNPIVNSEKKKRILNELLKAKVSDVMMRFVLLLVSKNREKLLPDIIEHFNRFRDERLGILNVTTCSAVKMTNDQIEYLQHRLEQITKKKVKIKFILDESLKGGFTIQFDDTIWDASVKHQLELLKQRFVEGAIIV